MEGNYFVFCLFDNDKKNLDLNIYSFETYFGALNFFSNKPCLWSETCNKEEFDSYRKRFEEYRINRDKLYLEKGDYM